MRQPSDGRGGRISLTSVPVSECGKGSLSSERERGLSFGGMMWSLEGRMDA